MHFKTHSLFFSLLLFLNLSACSGIQKHFPDKEKDYQLTTEIPDLAIPADLSSDVIQYKVAEHSKQHRETTLPNSAIRQTIIPKQKSEIEERSIAAKNGEIDVEQEEAETETVEELEIQQEEVPELVYIELLKFSGGATRIRVEAPLARVWRVVGKAISRHSIEILDRNETDRTYVVKYDADFEKVEDGSLWDEVVFIFGSDPAQEKTYKIRVVENGALIEVIVLDENDKPLSNDAGLELLKLVYNSMKLDLNGDVE